MNVYADVSGWALAFVCLAIALLLGAATLVCVYRWAPAWLLDGGMAIARWRAGLRSVRLKVGTEEWVYFDSGGDGAQIVLVHGYAANKESWLGLASRLKGRGYRLLIPDLPGFGQSSPATDDEYGVATQAERLRGFTQALQLDRFHLIGHSMGGYVAGAYTALYPHELLSTYLVAPAGVNGGVPPLLRRKGELEGRNPLFVDSVESFHSTMAIAMVKPPRVPLRLIEVIVERELPLRALRQTQTDFWFSDPLENMLRGCGVPLRLLWGELDQVLPVEGAQQLLATVTLASLKRLPGVGHMPLVEAPDELTRDYLDFIRTHGRASR